MSGGKLTWRTLISYGLTAGLRFSEMGRLAPGLVCDLYVLRMRYDDMEHGIRRGKETIYD